MQAPEGLAGPRASWLLVGAAAVLMGLVLRSAWVTEDAYITLRTVDNWVHGHGLRWNIDERVQGYTHPLWMFLLSIFYSITREDFVTTIAVGLFTTLAAIIVLTRLARSAGHALAAIVLLTLSRTFIDYSTSGLENPLSHLLLALFVWAYAVREAPLRELALLAALTALNRLDAVVLLAPALVHRGLLSLRERGVRDTGLDALVGLSPLLVWEAFSLFYYGFLFPNTAYAKLNTAMDPTELTKQGFVYLLNTWAWDTPGMIALLLGLVAAIASRRPTQLLLALGVLLNVLYVVRVGGDFMIGRFLSCALFASLCNLAICPWPLEQPLSFASLLGPFALLFFHPSAVERYPAGDLHHSGVADERTIFRDGASLMMMRRTESLPRHSWVQDGLNLRARRVKVSLAGNVGFLGFTAGSKIHIVDWHALTDPLLARLPGRYDPNWRVGHYRREIPLGYLETIEHGTCLMTDPNLCTYHAHLREVVSGDLFSFSRLRTLLALNFGSYDHLIDRDRYRYPMRVRVAIDELRVPLAEDARWDSPGARTFAMDGIEIAVAPVSKAKRAVLMLDGNDEYEIAFRKGNEDRGAVELHGLALGNLHSREVEIPEDAASDGFDRIVIQPLRGDGFFSVAHVRLEQ